MPGDKIKEYLDNNNVRYVSTVHCQAFTAQEVAASAHIPGRRLAKTVIVKIDGKMVMAVLPASHHVDFDLLKGTCGAQSAELASESEFRDRFPECEIGAMPPFGNLYGMDVFVSNSLEGEEEIAISASSHTELIRLAYEDFKRLTGPKVGRFSSQEKL